LCYIVPVFRYIFALSINIYNLSKFIFKPMNTSDNDNKAVLIHLSAFTGYLIWFPLVSIIMPLIFWQAFKKDNSFVDHHGKEAVNFNLSFFIYNLIIGAIVTVLSFSTILKLAHLDSDIESSEVLNLIFSSSGIFIFIFSFSILGIIKLILIILATVKAGQGEMYRYPLTIRLIK